MIMWGLCTGGVGVYGKSRGLLCRLGLWQEPGPAHFLCLAAGGQCAQLLPPCPWQTLRSRPAPKRSIARGRKGSPRPCETMVCRTLAK